MTIVIPPKPLPPKIFAAAGRWCCAEDIGCWLFIIGTDTKFVYLAKDKGQPLWSTISRQTFDRTFTVMPAGVTPESVAGPARDARLT